MYWLDISTSARWRGPHVGISRVEFELLLYAIKTGEIGLCVFDKRAGIFRKVSRDQARGMVAGQGLLPWNDEVEHEHRHALRFRHPFRSHPHLWYLAQRLRRRYRDLRKTEILSLHQRKFGSGPKPRPELDLTHLPPVALGNTDVVISVGLDWEFKDLRRIIDLKAELGFRYISMVHDLIAISHPEFVAPGYPEKLNDYFGELFWLADGVICNSQAIRREVEEHLSTRGSCNPKLVIATLGVSNAQGDAGQLPSILRDQKFVAVVGTLEPRKNLRTIYAAWQVAIRDGMVDPRLHTLVLVGRKGWIIDDLLHEMTSNPLVADNIVVLGAVGESMLMAIYQHAAALAFPSFYEGFGLPLAEAMSFGTPCLSSGQGALAEVGAGLVTEIDPFDVMGWAQFMSRALTDDAWHSQQKSRLQDFQPITWEQASEDFFKIVFQEFPECMQTSSH